MSLYGCTATRKWCIELRSCSIKLLGYVHQLIIIGQGNRFCCLYTDLANPTSNAIYKRIGYNPVSDASVYLVVRRET